MEAIFVPLILFIGSPLVVFSFIFLVKREKSKVQVLQYKKELAEIELNKEMIRLEVLKEENKKYDHLISNNSVN